jgi:hypothetical protein
MKTLLALSVLGGLAAATFQTASPAAARQDQSDELRSNLLLTEWIGVAASPNGKVFGIGNQSDEAVARNAAKHACEGKTGRTCTAIAVPMSWDVVVLTCSRRGQSPLPIVAGSGQNAAIDVALLKALDAGVNPRNCSQGLLVLTSRSAVPKLRRAARAIGRLL